LPADEDVLPLGHYMLFAMVDDIPSSAQIVNVLPRIAGDIDGDGVVNAADLAALLGAWGSCAAPCPPTCAADLNGDCSVDGPDLAIVLGNWS